MVLKHKDDVSYKNKNGRIITWINLGLILINVIFWENVRIWTYTWVGWWWEHDFWKGLEYDKRWFLSS